MTDQTQYPDSPVQFPRDDVAAVESAVAAFLRERVRAADADGVVVAMSGGLDSTVTATLAAEALGPDRVLGLALPCHKTDACAAMEAETVADHLGIAFQRVHLRPLLQQFHQAVVPTLDPGVTDGSAPTEDRALGNAIARFRMTCAYYVANRTNRLVVGTANRSELLLGYVTKHGDAGADLFPLGDLYKTEVRELARHLGLPDAIVERTPTAGFRVGQTDADDLGATYDVVDAVLWRVVEQDESVERVASALDVAEDTAARLVSMCSTTAHKRSLPPTPGIGDRVRRPTDSPPR
ncbi:NAD+ synthase [Haloarcula sp. JP-L23]|uniref:NAD+ synthase n=1 Tax=Haloarcula sp. JP-L23 TaxID=2716717 RepID=UPI00140EE4D4|nr:NAD+ synthase [Haloarcula sp. JP-L23]